MRGVNMALFKRKSETTISWYLTNDMKPNVKYYDKNYDKKTALINFLIRNKVSMDLIDQVMLEEDPFWLVYKSFKEIGVSEKIHNGQNVEEDTLYRHTRMTEIEIIENSNLDQIINKLFYAMIENILLSAGYMYITDGLSDPFSQYTYKDMLNRLSKGEVLLDDTIMTAFHIAFLVSNKEMENFLDLFEWSWNNCLTSYMKQFANRIGGVQYLKGLFYKNIENSINHHESYNAKKIIDNNKIDLAKDCDVNNIVFSPDSEGNQILFKECFDDFKKDLLKVRYYIEEANKIKYNKLFDYEIDDDIFFNKESYFVDYKPYTSTGRKAKYPLIIKGTFSISKDNEFIADISYNQKGKVSRIEINMNSKNIHRVIIAKEINNELTLAEIKEHNIMVDAFPTPIYKYDK